MWILLITLLLVIIGIWFERRRRHFSILKNMGIPGPVPSFWFGNMRELCSKDPLECFDEWLKKYGDVTGYYFGIHPMIMISDVDILKKVQVSEFQKFVNRPTLFLSQSSKPGDGFTAHLTNQRDKRWKELRSTVTPAFTTSKMKTMAPIINNAIDTLIEKIDKNAGNEKEFDIYEMYQSFTMDVIGRTAFGIQTDCQRNPNDRLLKTSRLLFSGEMKSYSTLLMFSFPELVNRLVSPIALFLLSMKNNGMNPIRELVESVRSVIKMRKENTRNRRQDLMQLMIDARVSESVPGKTTVSHLTAGTDTSGESEKTEPVNFSTEINPKLRRSMNDDEILDNSVNFFLAGYETTSSTLAFTTHFLLHYPEVQERVRNEVKDLFQREGKLDYTSVHQLQYLDQVVTESLRLYPPIFLFVNREIGEDVSFGDVHLKKGAAIQVPVYSLQRDERYWPDPNRFDPDRFSPENKERNNPFAFQAFGAGPRNCVGMRLAQMEVKLAVARILLKYRLEKCNKTDKIDLTLTIGYVTMSPRNGIYLKAVLLEK